MTKNRKLFGTVLSLMVACSMGMALPASAGGLTAAMGAASMSQLSAATSTSTSNFGGLSTNVSNFNNRVVDYSSGFTTMGLAGTTGGSTDHHPGWVYRVTKTANHSPGPGSWIPNNCRHPQTNPDGSIQCRGTVTSVGIFY